MKHDSGAFIINEVLQAAGYRCWFVGGCVRDTMLALDPKDIDIATDATPDEYVAALSSDERTRKLFATGEKHGTYTVVVDDQSFELTSLRTESDHDGRWATVAYTRDINEDLGRRDLTINAMALSFDNQLIDPYDGKRDLDSRRVRFVGVAEERMREDYLRILRFFRFHARFAGDKPLDPEAVEAINKVRGGLSHISVERIWSEMRRIIAGPDAIPTLRRMMTLSLFEIIGMPFGSFPDLGRAHDAMVTDPASLMGFYLPPEMVEPLAREWKWSRDEMDRARFIAENKDRDANDQSFRNLLVDGAEFEWVADLMRFAKVSPETLRTWPVPVFPLGGNDLIQAGFKPGPEMGALLRRLRDDWKAQRFTLDRETLLASALAQRVP